MVRFGVLLEKSTVVANESAPERDGLRSIIEALDPFDDETRLRILRTAQTFFGLDGAASASPKAPHPRDLSFGDRPRVSPKEFIREKQPSTDVDRVACLAYYLTHYRETPQFKTLDISKLNTEAAQIKFSNVSFAVTNATNAGYLAAAGKGNKQLTSFGEDFVNALPDRGKTKAVREKQRRRRPRRKSNGGRGRGSPVTAE